MMDMVLLRILGGFRSTSNYYKFSVLVVPNNPRLNHS